MTEIEIEGAKCLVTGGAGFIGSHLCDRLLDRGAEVVCLDNLLATRGSDKNIAHLKGNSSFSFLQQSVEESLPADLMQSINFVFHQAASKNTVSIEDPINDLAVNAEATLKLLLLAKEAGVTKFIHASTGSVYGGQFSGEERKKIRDPVSFYGVSKAAGELYCRVVNEIYGLDYTVLRYFHVIGTRQDSSEVGGVLPIFVRRSIEGKPIVIYGTGEQTRSFTSVHDVVEANIVAATLGDQSRGFFDCASGIKVTIQQLADYVQKKMGNDVEIKYADWRPGDIKKFEIDNSDVIDWGVSFNTDWGSIVDEVIENMRQTS